MRVADGSISTTARRGIIGSITRAGTVATDSETVVVGVMAGVRVTADSNSRAMAVLGVAGDLNGGVHHLLSLESHLS